MTVSSSTNRVSYSGNGTLTSFAYTFKIFDQNDLTVILRGSQGTETTQTITTHYTVTGVGSASGGNVVFGTAPANGVTVVILREQPLTQGLDLVANDPFPAQSLEEALDKLTFMSQKHEEELSRAIKASRTNTLTGSEFTISATDRANKVFTFDSAGNLSITSELGTFRGAWLPNSAYKERDIVKDTSTGNIFLVNTAHTSSGSTPLTANANSAKYDLIVDANSATLSKNAAAASATAAATSETNAGNSASAAATSATNAANSATASAASATSAAASFDDFDDRYLGAKSTSGGNPTVDNDGNALIDGALFFDTTNNVLMVYNLGTTTWLRTTPTSSDQTAINAVNADATDIGTVAGISSEVQSVAAKASLITSDFVYDLNTVAVTDVINDINTLATSDIVSDLNTLATSDFVSDLNTLATASNVTAIDNVSGSISNVNTVASNISGINDFAARYRIGTSNPSTGLDSGDLFYNTSTNQMLVYNGSVWVALNANDAATLTIFEFTATAGQTVFTGNDSNGVTLNYNTSNSLIAFNGVILPPEDYTTTSATVLTLDADAAASAGDSLQIYSFTSFTVAQPFLGTSNGDLNIALQDDRLLLTSTDASATAEPNIELYRNSASPADADGIGSILFTGEESTGAKETYAAIEATVDDITDGTENGSLTIKVRNTTGEDPKFIRTTFDSNNRRIIFKDHQVLRWEDHHSTSHDCTLTWAIPSANSSVKLPNASGAIGHLAFDSQAFSTTTVSQVQFQNIPDRFSDAEIHFRCQPATDAQPLNITFNDANGAEITTSDAYEWHYLENGSAANGTATNLIQICGNVGTANYEGISGKLTISGLRQSHANSPPASVFGQYVMINDSGALKSGSFFGTLNTANQQEVGGIRFKFSSGNFASRFFRAYGLRNTE